MNSLTILTVRQISSQFRKLSRITVTNSANSKFMFPIMDKQTSALLQNEEGQNSSRISPKMKCGIAAIALISTTTGLLFLVSFLVVTLDASPEESTTLTPDAEYWQKMGIDNAHKNLDQFDSISSNLSNSNFLPEITFLQKQITTVGDNNRILVPKIMDVITKINDFLADDTFLNKFGLKALVWYVDGKRDNKSYYLLDGARLWCELRIAILWKHPGKGVDKLVSELEFMKEDIIKLRDELDDMAQVFVKGIKKIHSMTDDISKNLEELRKTAKELMVVSVKKEQFLGNTKGLEKKGGDLVSEYSH